MVELTTLCIALISVAIIYYFIKGSGLFSQKNYPGGPWGLPVVGHLPFFGQNPPKTFMRWRQKYGNVFQIRMGSWKAVVVNGYSAVKEAAEKADDAFSGRPDFVSAQVLRSRTGDEDFAFGTFCPAFVQQRKLTAQALRLFTTNRQSFLEEIVDGEVDELAKTLTSKFENRPESVESDVQFHVASTLYQLLYGKGEKVDKDRHVKVIAKGIDEFNKFTGSGNPVDVMPWLRFFMPWKAEQLKRIQMNSDEIMFDQVKEHYKTITPDKIRDITDSILRAGEQFRDDGESMYELTKNRLIMTLVDLQGAGFDTTHKTILWLILYMAAYPDVQKRVQEEIDTVVGRDRKLLLADRPRLVYTDAAMHEVMRIVTMLPLALPHYAMRDSTIQGYDIDKDTVVIFNLYSVSHEDAFWGDPDVFRPARFIDSNGELDAAILNHTIPFGLGRRRCVGEPLAKRNVFVFFATLMQKCQFILPPGTDLGSIPGLVYTPKPFKVVVKHRD